MVGAVTRWAAAEPQDRLAAPRDRLNPCSWIGLARRIYRLKLSVRQVQMSESEPATWRRWPTAIQSTAEGQSLRIGIASHRCERNECRSVHTEKADHAPIK
jgi:hypothetical protein